ncbi:MAG: hypothetical protein ACKVZJ_02150 [Phycisphaerales bacterium]
MKTLKTIQAWVALVLLTPMAALGGTGEVRHDKHVDLGVVNPAFAAVADALAGFNHEPRTEGDAEDGGVRAITCPTGSVPEGEPACGFPEDNFNSGCNSLLQPFSTIICGAKICGTTRFDGVGRDTDWYQFSLGSTRYVTLNFSAEFRGIVGFVSGTNGSANCNLATGVSPFGLVQPNQSVEVSACLGPGTWWVFVAPDFNQANVSCGGKYSLQLTCTTTCPQGGCCFPDGLCVETFGPGPCVAQGGRYQGQSNFCFPGICAPPTNDNCANADLITCNATVFADTRNATFEAGEATPGCAQGSLTGSVWYRIIGTGGRLAVTTCDTSTIDPDAKDSVIVVFLQGANCGQRTQIACSDDAGCGPTLRHSRACFNTAANATYLIQVVPFDNASRGVFKLDIECVCTDGPVSGACCFAAGSCSTLNFSACAASAGVYQGDGTACSTANCPVVPPPTNDDCGANTPELFVPGTRLGSTLFGTPEEPLDVPECGPTVGGPGVWYRVIGNGRRISVSLCSPLTNFDTRLRVYCGNCASEPLVCVAANDNAGTACGAASETSWCSEMGKVYSVLVAGGVGAAGNFEIITTTEATPCAGKAYCSTTCTYTCPPGATQENEPNCGTFYEDVTNGGCGTTAAARGVISCGQTVCGKSGVFSTDISGGLGRDTDWFRFSITQQSVVTWTVRAEFMAQAFILNDNCADNFAYAGTIGNACQDIIVSATLEPGTYNVFVSPQFFEGVSCGDRWTGTLQCTPTATNGACCLSRCSCVVTTENDCLFNQFGIFFAGPGTTCAQTNCNPCPADINIDGIVNTFDLLQLLGSFGRDLRGDFNCSGQTNTADLTYFLNRFGRLCPN